MDLSKKNLLDPMGKMDSHSDFCLNLTELSSINLHDSVGFGGTALYDYFSSQLYFNGNNGNSEGYFDLANGYNATLMNPNVATPLLAFFPIDNSTTTDESTSTSTYQLEYPEQECYLQNEPTSPVDSMLDEVSNISTQQSRLSDIENNDDVETEIAGQQELTYKATIDDEKVYPKPACPFTYLVVLALKNSRTGALLVNEIYSFITEHFPYYRTAPKSWKSSLRHNLSFRKIFEKIATTSTTNDIIKRKNLWTINPTKIDTIDEKVLKWSHKHSLNLKQAMLHPEHLELLERGEMKFGSGAESSLDDSVYHLVPVAKRRKTIEGMPPVEYLYEVVTRRKKPLAKEAVVEPSFENNRAIEFSSHEF